MFSLRNSNGTICSLLRVEVKIQSPFIRHPLQIHLVRQIRMQTKLSNKEHRLYPVLPIVLWMAIARIHMHILACTYTNSLSETHIYLLRYAYIFTCTHLQITWLHSTLPHPHTHINTHALRLTYPQTHIHKNTSTYLSTYSMTYLRTHKRTSKHTSDNNVLCKTCVLIAFLS